VYTNLHAILGLRNRQAAERQAVAAARLWHCHCHILYSRAKCMPTEYRCYWTTVYVADSRLSYIGLTESPMSNQSSETLCLSKTTTNTDQSEMWCVKRVQFFKRIPQFSICGRTVSTPPPSAIDRRHCPQPLPDAICGGYTRTWNSLSAVFDVLKPCGFRYIFIITPQGSKAQSINQSINKNTIKLYNYIAH